MRLTAVLGAVAAAVLFFFGFIFILSAGAESLSTQPQAQMLRLIEGAILIVVGLAIAYVSYVFSRKPTAVIHQLELSGAMKASSIKCPNCSASVDSSKFRWCMACPTRLARTV
jgi:hypothetical protein